MRTAKGTNILACTDRCFHGSLLVNSLLERIWVAGISSHQSEFHHITNSALRPQRRAASAGWWIGWLVCTMGSYLSNTVISEVTLDAVTHVISWLHSLVDVVDKCFDSMPRGPAGSSHGDFAEVEFTVNATDSGGSDNNQSIGAKIRNSLKAVEMGSIDHFGVSSRNRGDGKGNQIRGGGGDPVCAVCLGDIKEEEKVYELPFCDHIFHSACLDRWVSHNHSTCPLCRTSLITGSSSSMAGGAIMMQDEEGSVDEGYGFSLGIWFIPRYVMNVNFDSLGWTHTVMWLAGF